MAAFEQPETVNNACPAEVRGGRPWAGLHHARRGWLRVADSRYEAENYDAD